MAKAAFRCAGFALPMGPLAENNRQTPALLPAK
jgi:hypothetical protein